MVAANLLLCFLARKTASGDGEVTKWAKSWGCMIKPNAKRMATGKNLELADQAAVGGGEVAAK